MVDFLQSYRKKLMCLNDPKGMKLVWIDNLKMPYCILVAGLIALLVFLILNRKKVDLDKLQKEYVRSRLSLGTLESVDLLDATSKHEFYQERI